MQRLAGDDTRKRCALRHSGDPHSKKRARSWCGRLRREDRSVAAPIRERFTAAWNCALLAAPSGGGDGYDDERDERAGSHGRKIWPNGALDPPFKHGQSTPYASSSIFAAKSVHEMRLR